MGHSKSMKRNYCLGMQCQGLGVCQVNLELDTYDPISRNWIISFFTSQLHACSLSDNLLWSGNLAVQLLKHYCYLARNACWLLTELPDASWFLLAGYVWVATLCKRWHTEIVVAVMVQCLCLHGMIHSSFLPAFFHPFLFLWLLGWCVANLELLRFLVQQPLAGNYYSFLWKTNPKETRNHSMKIPMVVTTYLLHLYCWSFLHAVGVLLFR